MILMYIHNHDVVHNDIETQARVRVIFAISRELLTLGNSHNHH